MPTHPQPQSKPRRKGQGALEYLLLIGGAVLIATIVLLIIITTSGSTNDIVQHNLDDYTQHVGLNSGGGGGGSAPTIATFSASNNGSDPAAINFDWSINGFATGAWTNQVKIWRGGSVPVTSNNFDTYAGHPLFWTHDITNASSSGTSPDNSNAGANFSVFIKACNSNGCAFSGPIVVNI
ncbi:MAG: class III signal peptide-containing protein [Candidatus Diapherotrites archaeon]|nr:class III signal peptide-containing protein [Candidatus Diapherotrites archaeon]MDZ4256424.1 class III signal peptide-containing protein [archaeon]